jgi:transcriptional regulator with XRE-family HTH domain
MVVARNIETIMHRKGMNSAELAKRLGSNPTLIYDILSGKSRNPRLDTLHKIAVKGLGVPVSALLHEPSDHDLDQELLDAFATMPATEQRRVLNLVLAYVAQASSA